MRHLAILAKYWQPGAAKTRLATRWGPGRAAEIHRAMLECLLGRLSNQGDRRTLVFWPPDRRAEFAHVAGAAWELAPQVPGDLGARIAAVLAESVATLGNRALVLGSDSPSVPLQYLETAWAALETHALVLGASQDGGYYLIGARGAVPEVFSSIDWGTPAVWSQTTAAAQAQSIPYAILPAWYDVDEPADLERLVAEIAKAPPGELARLASRLAQLAPR